MSSGYPSADVSVPVTVRAEALYFRKEDETEETTVCFVTRKDVVVPKGTIVRVPVGELSASAARAVHEHIQGAHGTNMDFQLKSRDFVDAARTIISIVHADEQRTENRRLDAASAKVRKVR